MHCDICSEEKNQITKNYKNTSWNVCDDPDCIETADERNETMDNKEKEFDNNIDELTRAIDGAMELGTSIHKMIEDIQRVLDEAKQFNCRLLEVKFDGKQSILGYVFCEKDELPKNSFYVSSGKSFSAYLALHHKHEHMIRSRGIAPVVKVGQGDNIIEWTPQFIEGKQSLIRSAVRIVANMFKKHDSKI